MVLKPEIDNIKTSVYSEGIKLLIHEPVVYASDLVYEKMISHHAETVIRLITTKTTCSNEVRLLDVASRECVYSTERKMK